MGNLLIYSAPDISCL